MSESVTIPKKISSKNDLDFEFLREEGLKYIENLGSKLWTDYNTHDPGITIMEMLCYAITDLSQRIEMPIENLLATETDNVKNMHEQFLSAVNILPSKPVTALDYRKLFVHLKGVKNAWIVKHEQKVFLNCKDHTMSYTPFEVDEKDQKNFNLQGLNDVYIDFEAGVEDQDAVLKKVKTLYHQNRNLCEDLVNIYKIPEQHISVCVYLDILPDADEERIQALIIKAIGHYFAPSVSFYALQQMYDKGYTTDKIFEGPVPFIGSCIEIKPEDESVTPDDFQGGFIDAEELQNASLRKQIRLSDIIQIIMHIEGVNLIKDISIKTCDDDPNQDKWIICVKENHKPVLCWDKADDDCEDCSNSVFNFYKGLLPIGVNKERVIAILEELELEETQELSDIVTEDVDFPLGEFSNSKDYTTIQNDFPDTYGISPNGLPKVVSEARKAKAKQLKGYLLFFDQILANYFVHLSKVKDLLSVDESLKKLYTVNAISELSSEEKQTYFTQKVDDITDVDTLVSPATYDDNLIAIVNTLKGTSEDTFFDRKNKLLDHLISRFAERFSDYAFIMKLIYGESDSKYQILKAKAKFVEDYKTISCDRGIGFNYCDLKVWDTNNVSGVQKRIARLSGISDFSRRNLLNDAIEIYDEKDKVDDNITEYRWRIKDGDKILLSSSKHYHALRDALKELFLSFELAKKAENYDLKQTKNGRTYFNIINPKITDAESEDYIVARRIAYTATQERSEQKRNDIIAFLNNLSAYEEGMYLVEHILMRPDTYNQASINIEDSETKNIIPDAPATTFMPSCIDGDCESCGPTDPYSFRVSVILPGWTHRFSNKDFRTYMENIIREEIPAHILARICWVGHVRGVDPDEENDMLQMQLKYRMFLEQLQIKCANYPLNKTEITAYREALSEFIPSFNSMHTIYDSGNLHDCNNDDTETKGNKIILGRTNIGNL